MALFASDEWAKALQKEINANRELAKAGKGFDATIQFMIKGAGKLGDIPFWTHMKDGKVLEVSSGKKKWDYTVSGDHGVRKCNTGARHQCGSEPAAVANLLLTRSRDPLEPPVAPIAAESWLSPGQSSM
jgi:hypothetical protein